MHARRWSGCKAMLYANAILFSNVPYLTFPTERDFRCAKEQKVCAKCQCCVDQIVERQLKMLERGIEERYYVFPFRAYMVANFALDLAPQEERKNNLLNALK
ncbi:hypothetical protein V6N12_001121 [Hibiscus sabdariffa]|uniref:Uncharacterized protein n=1 Tax=Hibiscus sabdariffa TaxID=183260 RepID=A0ABR2C6A9_9ROSI